jgi:hypothetical protein
MANMKLIQTVTVGAGGASSIDFTSIPQTYTDLMVLLSGRSGRTDSAQDVVSIGINGSYTNMSGTRLASNGSGVFSGSGSIDYFSVAATNTATSNTFGNSSIYFPNYANTSYYKSYNADGVNENNATEVAQQLAAGLWSSTSAITQINLKPQSGTDWQQYSTAYLYGISNVTTGSKATGGIVSYDSTYYYHMFPYSGTFTPTQSISADILVVAGGGGGGGSRGGGGGAGGFLAHTSQSLTAQAYTVTVGSGGSAGSGATGAQGADGGTSQFGSLTASVGGGGGGGAATPNGRNGGSGGGAASAGSVGTATSGQGNNGGLAYVSTPPHYSGGGGGAGAVGQAGVSGVPGNGGAGLNTYSTWATATQTGANNGYYAGGGGGGRNDAGGSSYGGLGGGGNGGGTSDQVGFPGIINTGGGGGAGANTTTGVNGGAGGSGIVIIRYAI